MFAAALVSHPSLPPVSCLHFLSSLFFFPPCLQLSVSGRSDSNPPPQIQVLPFLSPALFFCVCVTTQLTSYSLSKLLSTTLLLFCICIWDILTLKYVFIFKQANNLTVHFYCTITLTLPISSGNSLYSWPQEHPDYNLSRFQKNVLLHFGYWKWLLSNSSFSLFYFCIIVLLYICTHRGKDRDSKSLLIPLHFICYILFNVFVF